MSGDQAVRGLDRILELQDLDVAVDRLQARRRELESGDDVRAARERLNAIEERVGELRLALDSVAQEQRRLETEVSSLESKIAAEERRLYDGSVANPKELESIQHEIDALRRRKSIIEDQVLVQMERREDMESRLPPLEAELTETRDHLTDRRGAPGAVRGSQGAETRRGGRRPGGRSVPGLPPEALAARAGADQEIRGHPEVCVLSAHPGPRLIVNV